MIVVDMSSHTDIFVRGHFQYFFGECKNKIKALEIFFIQIVFKSYKTCLSLERCVSFGMFLIRLFEHCWYDNFTPGIFVYQQGGRNFSVCV